MQEMISTASMWVEHHPEMILKCKINSVKDYLGKYLMRLVVICHMGVRLRSCIVGMMV